MRAGCPPADVAPSKSSRTPLLLPCSDEFGNYIGPELSESEEVRSLQGEAAVGAAAAARAAAVAGWGRDMPAGWLNAWLAGWLVRFGWLAGGLAGNSSELAGWRRAGGRSGWATCWLGGRLARWTAGWVRCVFNRWDGWLGAGG